VRAEIKLAAGKFLVRVRLGIDVPTQRMPLN